MRYQVWCVVVSDSNCIWDDKQFCGRWSWTYTKQHGVTHFPYHTSSASSGRRCPTVFEVWLTWLLYHRHLLSLQWIRIQHGNDSRLVSSISFLNSKLCLTNPLMLTLDSSSPGSVFGIPTFHPTRRHHAARKYWWHGCMSSLGIYVEHFRHVGYRWAHVGHSDCAMVS